jgi:methionyl-tRNA formyltransferase
VRDLVVVGAVESTRVAVEAARRVEGWNIKAVVTLSPDQGRRHSDYCDLSPLVREIGADTIHASQINAPELVERLCTIQPDIILVVGWSQICRAEFLGICPGRILGYHPAPLPRLRGRAAIPWTILLGEPISAGTLFWMGSGADDGPIVEQRFFHVAADETARSLYAKHMAALGPMIQHTLRRVAADEAHGVCQNERFASYGARRTEADGRIDWGMSTAAIDRLVRAVGRPYPGAFSFRGEDRIIIWEAEPSSDRAHAASVPGQMVAISQDELLVRTADGLLRVLAWELVGGPPLKVHQRMC